MATLDDRPGSETLGQILAAYYKQRTEYEEGSRLASALMTGAYIIQLLAYYNLAKGYREDRDKVLEAEMDFLTYLHDRRMKADEPELQKKDKIREKLGEQTANVCTEATRYKTETLQDAKAFEDMEEMFAECSCAGIPDGWGIHDHTLAAGIAATSAGTMMPVSAKRRAEEFNVHRIDLINKANIAVRGLFTADSILAYYQQAITIYQGLMDTFISGFNSAGVGLGVSLQRLSGASPANGSSITINPLQVSQGSGGSGYSVTRPMSPAGP